MAVKREKRTIGRVDRIDFPKLNLEDVPCKIDTGADTSSLYCTNVRVIERDEQEFLTFRVLDPTHEQYSNRKFVFDQFDERKIRNSFGNYEYRYVIRTEVNLFGQTISTEFSLADRERMRYPVLIGKKLLVNRFIVDVSQLNLNAKFKKAQTIIKDKDHSES